MILLVLYILVCISGLFDQGKYLLMRGCDYHTLIVWFCFHSYADYNGYIKVTCCYNFMSLPYVCGMNSRGKYLHEGLWLSYLDFVVGHPLTIRHCGGPDWIRSSLPMELSSCFSLCQPVLLNVLLVGSTRSLWLKRVLSLTRMGCVCSVWGRIMIPSSVLFVLRCPRVL